MECAGPIIMGRVVTLVQTKQGLRFWSHGAIDLSDDNLPTSRILMSTRLSLQAQQGPLEVRSLLEPGAGLWSSQAPGRAGGRARFLQPLVPSLANPAALEGMVPA